jgi:heme/copper-type cytochrome/quinol oxidase subunit 2
VSARLRWLLFALLALAITFLPLPAFPVKAQTRTFRIQASRYVYSPAEIRVNPGDRVAIELVSQDVAHGLSLDGYDFNLSADPGQTAIGAFTAGKPGVFRFRCSEPCGNLHPFMLGQLRVGRDLLFLRIICLSVLAVIAGLYSLRLPPPAPVSSLNPHSK